MYTGTDGDAIRLRLYTARKYLSRLYITPARCKIYVNKSQHGPITVRSVLHGLHLLYLSLLIRFKTTGDAIDCFQQLINTFIDALLSYN